MKHRNFRYGRLLLGLWFFGLLLASCGDDGTRGSTDRVTVVATTGVIGALISEVASDLVEVETLISSGVDPHTFELRPNDIATLEEATLVLINGLGLDEFLVESVDSSFLVVVTEGVELLVAGDHDEQQFDDDGHEHEEGEFDPHVWQDPLRVKVMVANIAQALATADPDNAQQYRDNAAAYQARLDTVDAEIEGLIGEIPTTQRKIITNHDAFAYFADRYGLEIVGTVIPGSTSEADPSASRIAELSELIKAEGVRAIFAEDLIDPIVAETLASDAGIEIVFGLYSEQPGPPGSGAESVDGMLLANAHKIGEALSQP